MTPARLLIGALLLLGLSGCWNKHTASEIDSGIGFELLPPAAWPCTFSQVQRLRSERDGEVQEFTALLQVSPTQLRLIGINSLGLRLFELQQAADGQLQLQTRVELPEAFNPAWVLRDLQLASAPLSALRAALAPAWSLQEDGHGGRELRHEGQLEVSVTPLPSTDGPPTIRLSNHRHAYRLAVQTLQHNSADGHSCGASE